MKEEKMKVDSSEEEDRGLNHGYHDDDQQHHHGRINFFKKFDDTEMISNKKPAGSSSNEMAFVATAEKSSMDPDSIASSSNRKDQVNKLESARAEMGEVREENQRLKMCLDRVMKDYQSLQMQFRNIVEQDVKKSTNDRDREVCHEETELVSLTLGRFPSDRKREENAPKIISNTNNQAGKDTNNDHQQVLSPKQDLALGLDCKVSQASKSSPNQSPSTNNSLDSEAKEEAAGETWPPSKVLKTMRSSGEDAEVYQQSTPKKARVCVRARCDTPTMNDGCQWRKYGQKIAKGNPCPRAYYRCTGAPSCPVRKQVQRCADDMSILITTYEGTHNHPLPVSATRMASTTSAAASMLLSGSSTSRADQNTAVATGLQGLSYYLSDNSNSRQFYLPNSSMVSSSSPTHPTITLDLTSNPSSSSSSLSSSTHFNNFSSPNYYNYPPRYPFTNLDFGSNPQSNNMMSWSNGLMGYNNRNQIGTSTLQNSIYQSYLQKNSNPNFHPPRPQQPPLDTIAAATKAITADPSFQSALAAALTSIIGNSSGSSGSGSAVVGSTQGGGDGFGQKNKLGEPFSLSPSTYTNQSAAKGNACASSFLSKAPSSAANSQSGNLVFLAPNNSLPFSTSKSSSESPTDNRDQTS